ncbi:hypothetical protein BCV69DRAFT_281427 [Microstroma glucosiphilum]|uniref:CCHC-type domain-containing protein n=1 Tax=Pseudomicrostroma glucosiphilum TaxID=1684307 RepID=A0A316UDJ0_9BASI|nr:hypothetical protein BCV69DRAFT_281427 [Pseudomicrostroma glucosiphilum]PWN22433.1 hypothetical protein BCV69DRAFT_281427 [Pseudomicrostroma glucosiphilum]
MTRYTKLDGRKALHKATDLSAPRVAADDEQPTASTSASPLPPPSVPAPPSAAAPASITEADTASDPKKLQSRLKLLRLKIKNAKSEEKKASLQGELAEVQQSLHAANGQKGKKVASERDGSSKRKRANAEDAAGAGETNPWKKMEAERRAKTSASSEARREKRIAERNSQTRCFACRAMGHAAKDCPQALNSSTTALEGEEQSSEQPQKGATSTLTGKETVGICFRCGSTQHILARCRRPAPQVGSDLPFATCFVCQEKGHLSSKCPRNASHGVYPNGGCCKLCSSVEHLAKDCDLRSSSATVATNATVGGAKRQVGADEDDFIDFARRKVEVDREEKRDGKRQKVAMGGGIAAPKRKVVSF